MVSKKILGVAIAAAFSSQAFAQVNLDASAPVKVVFAQETLQTADEVTVNSVKYLQVNTAGADLNLVSKIGVGVAIAGKTYIRVDVDNALFGAAPTLTEAGAATIAPVLAQGGVDSSFAIYEVTVSVAPVVQADIFTVAISDLKVNSAKTPVNYGFAVYETLTAAVNKTSPLYTASSAKGAAAVTVGAGTTTTLVSNTVTADVEAGFKKFTGGALKAALGDLQIAAKADTAEVKYFAADGTAVTANKAVDPASVVTVTGDFSFASAANLSADGCTTLGAALTIPTAKTSATTTLGALAAAKTICLSVDGTKEILAGAYTSASKNDKSVEVGFTAPLSLLANASGATGTIVRNGTSIEIPYLTTFEDYNQRLVLVNRGSSAATYSITFTSEAGVTTAAGAKATGTLAAKSTTIIPAKDLVTITGSSRTAASVSIVAPKAGIDAAVTQVNLSDKSTDTVKLSSN